MIIKGGQGSTGRTRGRSTGTIILDKIHKKGRIVEGFGERGRFEGLRSAAK